MVGRKLLYTGGFLLFVLSSALCGLAPSLPVLIAFRVAQGIGAALRSCGISIGVAAASSLLAWRLAVRTGSGHNTLHAEAQQLLAAGRDVIVLLGSFAAMAGVISLARVPARRPATQRMRRPNR
jgi:MFS family permease